MLTVTRARALFKPVNENVSFTTKFVFIFVLINTISACSDQKQHASDNKDSNDQTITSQANDDAANRLLEDGFYLEQAADGSTSDIDTPSDVNSEEETPEPQTDQTNSTPFDDIATSDTKALIEDLGFLEAQQDQLSDETETSPAMFCLDKDANAKKDEELLKDACQQISNRLASVNYAACEAAKLKPTGCTSVKGFPILMSEFAPLKTRKPQGRILIVGGTHGDELTSVSMTIRWIEKLNRHHSGLFHWHMVPMMNPDGVLKRGATRTNDNGVDLNRNMPSDDWERNAIKYWVEKGGKDPRKYPGEAASSEPETQWLIDEIKSFKPDAIISIHAPYGVVDFDSLLLNTAPKNLGKLHLNLLGTYPGSLGNYAGINLNIPVITLELPHAWEMPSEKESTKIWEDIVSWLKKNVRNEVAQN